MRIPPMNYLKEDHLTFPTFMYLGVYVTYLVKNMSGLSVKPKLMKVFSWVTHQRLKPSGYLNAFIYCFSIRDILLKIDRSKYANVNTRRNNLDPVIRVRCTKPKMRRS